MNINLEYEIGKGKVSEYIDTMNKRCSEIADEIKAFDKDMFNSDEFEYFNRDKQLKFIRMWNIIQSDAVTIAQRNLLCAFAACDNKLSDCLDFFNGKGKNIKNKRTLAVLISNARKAVTDKYNELYE